VAPVGRLPGRATKLKKRATQWEAVQKSVVKKVRLTPKEAKSLARLAKQRKTTESEILRDGLRGLERLDARRRAIKGLIELAKLEDTPWEKPRPDVKW
jgi:hypothetical protein